MYKKLEGCNPPTFFILPMIDRKPSDFPGFVDVYTAMERLPNYEHHLQIFVKTGGENSKFYSKFIEVLKTDDNYVTCVSDSILEDYSYLIFKIPVKHQLDYVKFVMGNYDDFSLAHKNKIERFYPELGHLLKYEPTGASQYN